MNGRKCPNCGKPIPPKKEASEKAPLPFCSARCRSLDLGNWLDGRYIMGAEPAGLEGDDDEV